MTLEIYNLDPHCPEWQEEIQDSLKHVFWRPPQSQVKKTLFSYFFSFFFCFVVVVLFLFCYLMQSLTV